MDIGSNVIYCQAFVHGGTAFYPTRLGPVAPGSAGHLFPDLYRKARDRGMPVWSYMCAGMDLLMCNHWRQYLTFSKEMPEFGHGFLPPESPWTDLLCRRVREFLGLFPVDWLLFDWFVYGDLKPDAYRIEPRDFMQKPFREVIGRDLPATAEQITADENLRYKRAMLAQQFYRLRDAVKETSPSTRIIFNVPYWQAAEPLWVDHPMLNESDGLFAECSRIEVVEWLLSIRKPGQRVMTTLLGRQDDGECDPHSWRRWYDAGCDFFGYAWGAPGNFRPHPRYAKELEIIRSAFGAIQAMTREAPGQA